jgi:hypothetical protein
MVTKKIFPNAGETLHGKPLGPLLSACHIYRPLGIKNRSAVTGLVPATGEAEVQHVDKTWVEPALHTAQTIVDSSGLTQAEEDKLNMVYIKTPATSRKR